MDSRPQHSPRYKKMCRHLKSWREDAGLTQRELAKKLEQSQSYVYKSENAFRRMDPIEFIAWTRACGVDPETAIKCIKQ